LPGQPAPDPADLAKDFPQLEILDFLGQGGMGAVYKARQKSLDRMVALKILTVPDAAGPDFAERFSREARALASLSHSAIVTVYDFGKAGDRYFLMMEFVDGANLHRLIRGGEIEPSQALELVSDICEALQFAHESGVVHRDIKPENILVDKKGRVKIADFGLAKILGHAAGPTRLTGAHQVMGTAHYMAPEQLERPLEVDHRADIYSLGVVFYELLTGELPIGRFQPPSRKIQVDVRVDDVVLKTLEKEPELRYQHASDVKTQVDGIKSSLDKGGGVVDDVIDEAAEAVEAVGEIFGDDAKVIGWAWKPSGWTVAAIGVVLLGAIALVILGFASLTGRDIPVLGVTVENPEVSVGSAETTATVEAAASDEREEGTALSTPPLVIAAARGNLQMVEMLLNSGAEVNAQDRSGTTALSAAVDGGHDEVVPQLLAQGADVNRARTTGVTPLMIAAARGKQELVELLLNSGANTDATDRNGWTALASAVDNRHDGITRLLLNRGADVDGVLETGVSPLMIAASRGDEAVVRLLLDKGANTDSADRNGWTALHSAVDNGDAELVRLLLEHGADVNATRVNGVTALMVAASRGNEGMVQALLTRGANVGAVANDGTTALSAAVDGNHEGIVELLLAAG
jgi:ankyrin repeat protein/predicted Ser/Thr protein kinase